MTQQTHPELAPQWHRVSPKYAVSDLIINVVTSFLPLIVVIIVSLSNHGEVPLWLTLVLWGLVAFFLINSLFAFRRVKAIGYVLREDDLLFRRGIMFERIVSVPYGRLQLVDITRGPLLRALGLSTLKFVTASAATGVQLPGLQQADAEALRDRLVELAESRRSGL
ncbi:PH domain-containing protein [Leucobacter albus]|uniref:PH domain-containing protein n=1 Tax=Leucobacter albus TaxID=272210 RepID=A0ABW3TQK9_9MICO